MQRVEEDRPWVLLLSRTLDPTAFVRIWAATSNEYLGGTVIAPPSKKGGGSSAAAVLLHFKGARWERRA